MAWQKTLQEKVRALNATYSGAGWYLALVEEPLNSYNFTADNTDIFTATGHNFINGCRVKLTNTSGYLPTPLIVNTEYRIINVSGNTFQLSTEANYNPITKTGTPINLTDIGSGLHAITEQTFIAKDDWEVWARYEVNYQGSGRQSLTIPTATRNDLTNQATLGPITASIIPINASIVFRYACIITGANATPNDPTGSLVGFNDFLTGQTLTTSGKGFSYTAYLS